jgi:hypothetical protein
VYLEGRPRETHQIFTTLLAKLETEGLDSSYIVHLLISLTCLANERYFGQIMEDVAFYDKISEFVETYSTTRTEDEDMRKTILDMCAHLYHQRDNVSQLDTSEVMEYNT